MKIQQLSDYAPPTRAAVGPAATSAEAEGPQDTVERGEPGGGLMKRVGITALGGGSVGGIIGFGVDLVSGQGFGGPAWSAGVTIGLGAGAVIGLAGYAISRATQN